MTPFLREFRHQVAAIRVAEECTRRFRHSFSARPVTAESEDTLWIVRSRHYGLMKDGRLTRL